MFFHYSDHLQVVITVAYVVILAITMTLYFCLRNKSEKIRRIPLTVIAVTLFVLEVSKQIKNLTGLDVSSFTAYLYKEPGEYSGYSLPFHFCSFFIFWPMLSILCRGKAKKLFENLAFLWSSLIMILTFFYPESVYADAINSFAEGGKFTHTLLFHWMVLLYFTVSVALKCDRFEWKKTYQAPLATLIYGAVAIPAAFLFDANYCSILSPDFFAFLQPFLDVGYPLYEAVLVTLGAAVVTLVYVIGTGLHKLREKVPAGWKGEYGFIAFTILLLPVILLSRSILSVETTGSLYLAVFFGLWIICHLPFCFWYLRKAGLDKRKGLE